MGSRQRYGSRNNLIRWVRRHEHVATLFRSTRHGASLSHSIGRFPSTREEAPFEFQTPSVLQHKDNQEVELASPGIGEQAQVRSRAAASPVQRLPASDQPLAMPASEAPKAEENNDHEWQRLQAIFRKHRAQAEIESSGGAETVSSEEEPPTRSTHPGSLEDPSQPEPKHVERPGLQTVFRKPQAQAGVKPAMAQKARTSKTVSARPILRAQSDVNDEPAVERQGQRWQSMQPKGQEPEEANAELIQSTTSSPLESLQSIPGAATQGKEALAAENRGQHVRSIQRSVEQPAKIKPVDSSDSTTFEADPAGPAMQEGLSQQRAHPGQAQPAQHIQPESEAPVEEKSLSPEATSSKAETAVPSQQDAPSADQRPSVIQKVWQGLGAIFRRPQKPGEARTVGKQSSAKPGVELAKRDSQQPRNAAEGTAEAMSVIETGQASLPVQPALKAALSSEPVQRFHENIGGRNRLDEPQMIAKSRARLSLAAEQEPVMEADLAETNPSSRALETMIDLPDQASESDHLPQQPVPLQAVWNVQRLEEPEIGTNQSGSFSAQDIVQHVEALAAQGTAGAGEPAARSQPIAPDRERQSPMEVDDRSSPPQSSFEGSRAPVEILPPSRPRPAGASVVPPRPAVQRQPENRHAAGELHEPTMVDTAIGPLPSDLWSLLGQKPPVSSDQRDVQRKTAVRPSSAESSSNQKTFLHEYTAAPAEKAGHTAHSPTVLQRQIESSVSSTGPEQDQASPSEEQEKASAEPDLHDLAQKVYAEVRRRLATESERTHRYV